MFNPLSNPTDFIGMWVLVSLQSHGVNEGLRHNILAAIAINYHIAYSVLDSAPRSKNGMTLIVFFYFRC